MAEGSEELSRVSTVCNVSVTVNNGSSKFVGGGRQAVTITSLPPGYCPTFLTTTWLHPCLNLSFQLQVLEISNYQLLIILIKYY